jgi:hypothetical protein
LLALEDKHIDAGVLEGLEQPPEQLMTDNVLEGGPASRIRK